MTIICDNAVNTSKTQLAVFAHLLAETEGPQEGVHIIKLSIAKALQPVWVTGLTRQTHCTNLELKNGDRISYETEKAALYRSQVTS